MMIDQHDRDLLSGRHSVFSSRTERKIYCEELDRAWNRGRREDREDDDHSGVKIFEFQNSKNPNSR